MPVYSIFDGPITNLLSIFSILIEIFSHAHAKGGGGEPQWFQVWYFYWLFSEWWRSKHGSGRVKGQSNDVTCRALSFCVCLVWKKLLFNMMYSKLPLFLLLFFFFFFLFLFCCCCSFSFLISLFSFSWVLKLTISAKWTRREVCLLGNCFTALCLQSLRQLPFSSKIFKTLIIPHRAILLWSWRACKLMNTWS